MSEYIVDRYAESLTKYDVENLFFKLVEIHGNIKTTADKIGIQRKTVYDWDKNSLDIKFETKRKILSECLKVLPEYSLNYIVAKYDDNFKEILERYMVSIYEKAIYESDCGNFGNYLKHFNDERTKYRFYLMEYDSPKLHKMIFSMNEKAEKMGIEKIKPELEVIDPKYLSEHFIHLLNVINKKEMTKNQIIERFDLPKKFLEDVLNTINYIDPSEDKIGKVHSTLAELMNITQNEDVLSGFSRAVDPHFESNNKFEDVNIPYYARGSRKRGI